MKKIALLFVTFCFAHTVSAKYVKFAVDMTGQVINATGVHVFGNFQTAAGFAGGDWNPGTTPLTQEGTSNVYSTVVNLPANNLYKYQYINGDQTYEIEFVPIPSRVLYNNGDSRWLYIDSLANDTTYIGAIRFSGNAPVGKRAMRIRACMGSGILIHPTGVHIASTEQAWNPAANRMWSFDGQAYEYINFIDSSVSLHEFRFVNGNSASQYESVPTACNMNNNRVANISNDTILPAYYFSSCDTCVAAPVGSKEILSQVKHKIFPNPANNLLTIQAEPGCVISMIRIQDLSGRNVVLFNNLNTLETSLDLKSISAGLYLLTIQQGKQNTTTKLIIEH